MKAILSDIHGNLEALQAVFDDIARFPVDAIYSLGDMIGYGPDPLACIDLSMSMSVVLRGNFDADIFLEKRAYPTFAEQSVVWTKGLLESSLSCGPNQQRHIDYLRSLPTYHSEGDLLFVHGTPRRHVHEYLFPEDVYNQQKLQNISDYFRHICFNGHTHCPGVFVETTSTGWQHLSSEQCHAGFRLDNRKVICNVGSVGQPRDGDWRACYVLLDDKTIIFRRMQYDIEKTIAKIYAVPELADFNGDRLREGR